MGIKQELLDARDAVGTALHNTNTELAGYGVEPISTLANVPDAIAAVYEEGQNVGRINENTHFSNALKGEASGETVTLTDVSPVEHAVEVTVSGDETAKVLARGKNLLDRHTLIDLGGVEQEDGSIYFETNPTGGDTVYQAVGDVGQITLSYKVKVTTDESYSGIRFQCVYTDGSIDYIGNVKPLEYQTVTWTSSGDRKVDYIKIDYGTSTNSTWLKDVQLELGTTATAYEEYRGAEYEQGQAIASIYPTMTITTDAVGALVDVKYNRDINKAFDTLVQAIISLGGTV